MGTTDTEEEESRPRAADVDVCSTDDTGCIPFVRPPAPRTQRCLRCNAFIASGEKFHEVRVNAEGAKAPVHARCLR